MVIYADDEDTLMTALHTSFKLGKSGEVVGLYDTDDRGNRTIDLVVFDEQTTDVSFGRESDGAEDWQQFAEPTPGSSN
mgnify:FL=1